MHALKALATRGGGVSALDRLIGSSPVLRALKDRIRRCAAHDDTVLVRGPSGSGKELVAEALHDLGRPARSPFLPVNVAALSSTLFESQLFGHVRGAFTGATTNRAGLLLEAGDGTVLLDEIGELALEQQAKLLRVLETRRVLPVGSSREVPFHARIVAATHVDLEARVRRGAFREDLYFRLRHLEIHVPSLDERCEDIAVLARAFCPEGIELSEEAVMWLTARIWPGNVRELRAFVRRAAHVSDTRVIEAHVLAELDGDAGRQGERCSCSCRCGAGGKPARPLRSTSASTEEIHDALRAAERASVLELLVQHEFCIASAARELGVHRKTLERRMKRLGIERDRG